MNQNNNMECMNVIKRDGTTEEVSFDKVLRENKEFVRWIKCESYFNFSKNMFTDL